MAADEVLRRKDAEESLHVQVVGLKMEMEDSELEADQEGLSIAAGINQNLPEQVRTPQMSSSDA